LRQQKGKFANLRELREARSRARLQLAATGCELESEGCVLGDLGEFSMHCGGIAALKVSTCSSASRQPLT